MKFSVRRLGNERGATLMVVLVMIVVIGLAAGITGSTWKTMVQKSREEELFFRGDQYRRAIGNYFGTAHPGMQGQYPSSLEDLLKDPRSLATVRHIRKLYKDPFTDDDWVLIKDEGGRIKGVRSASTLEPFRKDGFPPGYEHFKGAQRYSDWEFVFVPQRQPAAQPRQPGVSNIPLSNFGQPSTNTPQSPSPGR